jgi:hypothetical protein
MSLLWLTSVALVLLYGIVWAISARLDRLNNTIKKQEYSLIAIKRLLLEKEGQK